MKIDAANLIITIDGPAGAGKSTVARGVAKALGFSYLDTGAIYRVATLAAMRAGIDLANMQNPKRVFDAVDQCKLKFVYPDEDSPVHVFLDGDDVTAEIRTEAVTQNIRYVADLREVRAISSDLQRSIAAKGKFVCEGRDQGTVVFPDAFLKIYLWASPEVRAGRRTQELRERGDTVDTREMLTKIRDRDRLDMSREVGGLKKAHDAVELDTSNMTAQQAIDAIVKLARERL